MILSKSACVSLPPESYIEGHRILKKNVRYFFLFYLQLYPFYLAFFFTFFTDGLAFFGKYSKKLFISSLVAMLLGVSWLVVTCDDT
jgi:hypothetical protein